MRSDHDRVLDALGDPSRRAILRALKPGPRSVAELAAELPVTRPAVSQHLKVLLEAGLVTFEREGTRNLYRLDRGGIAPVQAWVDDLWGEALHRYAARAAEIARGPD
jgi:DNA-binding transcriptional ArsR family regulator